MRHISPRNHTILWGIIVTTVLVNIAGFAWNLYDQFSWFDRVVHAYTTFAVTLLLALLLYRLVLRGAQAHSILFILAAASLGIAIGVLWEVVEWVYDQFVSGHAVLDANDTILDLNSDLILDLVMDTIGAIAGGILSVKMINAFRDPHGHGK